MRLFIICLAILSLCGCEMIKRQTTKTDFKAPALGSMLSITNIAYFEQLVSVSKAPILCLFYNNNSLVAKTSLNKFKLMAATFTNKFLIANINLSLPENRLLELQYTIKCLPTILLLDKSNQKIRVEGQQARPMLINKISQYSK